MKTRRKVSTGEVVAIALVIVVVGAIICPALDVSTDWFKRQNCLSNLEKLGTAFSLYLGDYNQMYPGGGSLSTLSQGNPQGEWIWFDGHWTSDGTGFHFDNPGQPWPWRANPSKGSLWPYTDKDNNTYICPSDPNAIDPSHTTFGAFGLSYTMNYNIQDAVYGDTGVHTRATLSQIVDPVHTVLLAEGPDTITTRPFTSRQVHVVPFDGIFYWWQNSPTPIHQGGSNFLFCDNHAHWLAVRNQAKISFYRKGNGLQ